MAKKNETKELKNPFKKVSEQLPFYPDLTKEEQHPFYCVVVGETELGDDPEKKMPVFILADVETGEEVFCLQSYSVKKAVQAAKKDFPDMSDVVLSLHFKGKTTVKGKPFNLFDTAYCSLEDYKIFKASEVK